jgi:hypothetical protein
MAALFTIAKNMVSTHTHTIKKDEIMSFAGKWMELELITLSEIGQTQEDKCRLFSLIYIFIQNE